MLEVGKYNTLKIVKDLDFGVYLDGGNGKEILLPARYVPKNVKPGDEVEVFIYHDNEGRLIATTARPLATVGEFKFMEVKSVNNTGAFLEWGLMKDLLVPFKEQKMPMREGRWYLVYVHLDHITGRIVASARIDKYLDNVMPEYTFNQEVNLLVADETEIGYKVIINNLHWGLVYYNEVFRRLEKEKRLKATSKKSAMMKNRRKPRSAGLSENRRTGRNHSRIVKKSGRIYRCTRQKCPGSHSITFPMQQKSFKQAIGALYKQHLITLENGGISLAKSRIKQTNSTTFN